MAYTYLTLTNDVLRRFNEVVLNDSTFAGAQGQHAQIKDAVNNSIRDINQMAYEWPFNLTTVSQTLVANTSRYAFPSDFKTASMDTFRIQRDTSLGTDTVPLSIMNYEEYMSHHIGQEYNTALANTPTHVVKSTALEFILAPTPDKAYQLDYEYYSIPSDLVSASDVPPLPEQFRRVIVDGAMYYGYMFRGDIENTQLSTQKFEDGLKQMRSIYINRYDYVRSTMITRDTHSEYFERVN